MYNTATEETLPMQEKQDCTSHAWWYHIKRTIWFERSANCSKCQPNKQSKTPKRTRLDAKFFKSEYFKTEFAKINQSVINRELEKLFSSQGAKNNFESRSWEIFTLRKSLIISKSTLAQQILLIQLLQKNLVVTCRNLFVSCKISQINFPSKYQPLLRFRNIFTSKNQGKLVTMLILSYWKNVNTHLCFKFFTEWHITYGQTSVFLLFMVILDL